MKRFFLLISLLALSLFRASVLHAACSNPTPQPAGYAIPCPVWSLFPASVSPSGSLTLSASPEPGTDYIYTTAYYAKGSQWLPIQLQGNNAASSYSTGLASGSLSSSILTTLPTGTDYIVLWDWLWDATAQCYKGPGLNQCNTGTWRIQSFTVTATCTYSQSAYYTYSQSAYGSGTANLYIATNGNDANPCSQSQKCQTFNRAYQVAHAGDTVLVGAGTYGTQPISAKSLPGTNKLTPDGTEVTFKPESGSGTVVVNGDIDTGAGRYDLAFQDMEFHGTSLGAGSTDIHFLRVLIKNNVAFIGNNSAFISFQQANLGPYTACNGCTAKLMMFWGSNNILVEDSSFHDFNGTPGIGQHPDTIESCGTTCPGNSSVHDITLRRNKFWNNVCDDSRLGDPGDSNFTLENNFYGATNAFEGGCAITLEIDVPGAIVRYNTFGGIVTWNSTSQDNNQVWRGNLINANIDGCPVGTGTTADHNVWLTGNNTTCGAGANNVVVSNMTGWYVNPISGDLHLTASGAPAIDAGNPSSFPATDIDGQTRPIGGAPDAGADEF